MNATKEARKTIAWLQWQLNHTIATADSPEEMVQAIHDCASMLFNLADELWQHKTGGAA